MQEGDTLSAVLGKKPTIAGDQQTSVTMLRAVLASALLGPLGSVGATLINMSSRQVAGAAPQVTQKTQDDFEELARRSNFVPRAETELAVNYSEAPVVDPFAPKYEPEQYNDNSHVRFRTNCYTYALNNKEDTLYKPQPGEAAGLSRDRNDPLIPHVMDATFVSKRALMDGLVPVQSASESIPGHYHVALFIDQGRDHHWARKNPDGTWSHKMGSTRVQMLTDGNGQPVTNIDGARLRTDGGVYEFAGYFRIPEGGLKIGTQAQDNPNIPKVSSSKAFANATCN